MMRPLAKAATLLPPTAFRADPLVAFTAFGRYIPYLLQVHHEALSNQAHHHGCSCPLPAPPAMPEGWPEVGY